MSKSIDERIVEMQFNNQQFESGVRSTLGSIDKLKSSLNFDKSSKGLSGLSAAASSLTSNGLAGVGQGVDLIASRFTKLGIMGVTALTNITNAALNAGKNLVKSLTIDPITDGFGEYEKKVNSIATILTNTAKAGTTINDVTKALNELNDYSDRTIYNFGNMADSIGKFTAKGVDLKTSVASVKGIANLGAATGASAQQVSTAMYQLSQAIGTGLKAVDYMSVENAGLSGTIFEDRLKAEAKALGTWNAKAEKAFKSGASFRQSLESGWVTGKVLQNVLADLGNDETLTKKAGEVRTFTSLLNTMKESVASGWAQTWETIIGNKDEATKLFTGINDAFSSMIGPSTEARNGMLEFWKANKGRDMFIEGIREVWDTVDWFVTSFKYEWSQLFPKKTGADLVAWTKKFRDLAQKIKPTVETLYNFSRIVKGALSVLSIGKQLISALAKNVWDFGKSLKPLGSGLLSVILKWSDWVTALDKSIKQGDKFNVFFKSFREKIGEIANSVKEAVNKIINAFKSFSGIDLSGVDSFVSTVKTKFSPFEKLGTFFKKVFDVIVSTIKKIGPIFSKVGTFIGNAFKNVNMSSILQLFNIGLISTIILGIKKFIDSLGSLSKDAGGFLKGITSLLDGVKGCLTAWQNDIKAGTLLKIAIAIGILAGALLLLSMIDGNKLNGAMTALTVLFGELLASMAIFDKIAGDSGFKSMRKVTTGLILLSIAVLILSKATKELASLDWDGMARGLVGVAALTAILIGTAKMLKDSSGDMIKSGVGLIAFGVAIKLLSSSVASLGELKPEALLQGLGGVLAVCAALILFFKNTDLDAMSISKGLGLIALALAIRILASAVKAFGKMDPGVLLYGLGAVGTFLLGLAGFTKIIGDDKGMIKIGFGLMLLAVGLNVLAFAVEKFGKMPIAVIAQGLITIGLALLMIAGIMKLMTGAIVGAAALLIISAALLGLAITLRIIGAMPIEQIGTALLALAGVFVVLGLAGLLLGPLTPLMLLLGASLIVLGIGLAAIGAASIVMAIGLSALAAAGLGGIGVLLAIAAAMLPITLLSPAIVVASIALTLLSVAIMAMGFALSMLGAGLATLTALGPSTMEILVALASTAAAVSKFALELLAAGIGLALFGAGAVLAGAGALVGGLGLIVLAAGLNMLSSVDFEKVKSLGDIAGTILAASGKLLLSSPGLLAGGKALSDFGTGAARTAEGLKDLDANLMTLVMEIKGMAGDISAAGQLILASVSMIIMQLSMILISAKEKVTSIVQDTLSESVALINGKNVLFVQSGMNLVDGFIQGIRSKVSEAARAASAMALSALRAANQSLEINSPSGKFEDVGMYVNLGLAKGLKKYSTLAESAAETMGQKTLSPVLSMATANSTATGIRPATATSTIGSIAQGLQNGGPNQRIIDSINGMSMAGNQQLDLNGVMTIQITNDKGEIIAIAQKAMKDLLRRESR